MITPECLAVLADLEMCEFTGGHVAEEVSETSRYRHCARRVFPAMLLHCFSAAALVPPRSPTFSRRDAGKLALGAGGALLLPDSAPAATEMVLRSTSPMKLPSLGLGAWAWGDTLFWGYKQDQDAALSEVFDYAVSQGVTFFDTAEVRCIPFLPAGIIIRTLDSARATALPQFFSTDESHTPDGRSTASVARRSCSENFVQPTRLQQTSRSPQSSPLCRGAPRQPTSSRQPSARPTALVARSTCIRFTSRTRMCNAVEP